MFQTQVIGAYHPNRHLPYYDHHRHYYNHYRPYYPDPLIYELMRDRNYYRDQYYDKMDDLYDIDRCHPYFNNQFCYRR